MRQGVQITVYLPEDLKEELLRSAKSNDRTMRAEVIRALRSHLGIAPPTVDGAPALTAPAAPRPRSRRGGAGLCGRPMPRA